MNVRIAGLSAFLCMAGAILARAEEFQLESVGTRAGLSKYKNGYRFSQVEAFANWNTPWRWDYECGCYIQTRLDLTAGWLSGRGEDGFIGSVGPTFELGRTKFPLTLEAGCNPTILSRDQFGHTDFGVPFQFTSHGSLLWRVGSRVTIEGRFQHMSNADIAPSNPGLNLYMLGLGWRF